MELVSYWECGKYKEVSIAARILLTCCRMESINFVHDVNMLRKTLKGVYSHSDDLRSLNSEIGAGPGNCRVQVLPVCWRHLLDFPKRREKKGEHDLGTTVDEEDECKSSRNPDHYARLTIFARPIT
jgi:hypothetical protein